MVFLVVLIVAQNHIRNQNPIESQVILIERKAILLIGVKVILAVGEAIQLEQEATEDESHSIIFNSFN